MEQHEVEMVLASLLDWAACTRRNDQAGADRNLDRALADFGAAVNGRPPMPPRLTVDA